MSYFSPNKNERNERPAKPAAAAADPRVESALASNRPQETVSTIGSGMLINGNIVSTGAIQVFGRVLGDIHAARIVICDGAYVEGKVIAQETVIDGDFKGTVHANTVKLQSTAKVDGEIYNKSLSIEQDAQFEGVARRLDKPIEAPSAALTKPEAPAAYATAPATAYTPVPAQSYAPAPTYPQDIDADIVQLTPSQAFNPANDRWRG